MICWRVFSYFRIDTVDTRDAGQIVQSTMDLLSIQPALRPGFSLPPCSFGHSCRKATACETVGFAANGISPDRRFPNQRSPDQRSEELPTPAAEETGSTMTWAIPWPIMSIAAAARGDISISSEGLTGPRSLIRTITERPFCRFVTRTSECSGSERCAAVAWTVSSRSPLEVSRPTCWLPYQAARPTCPRPVTCTGPIYWSAAGSEAVRRTMPRDRCATLWCLAPVRLVAVTFLALVALTGDTAFALKLGAL